MPWWLLIFIDWMGPCSPSLCYVFNSPSGLVGIMITYGVYLPIYFIARKVLFYILVCSLIIPSFIHYMSTFVCI